MSVEVQPENQTGTAEYQDGGNAYQEDDQFMEPTGNRFLLFQVMPSWLTSFVIHMALIILMALWLIPNSPRVVVSLESGEATEDVMHTESINFDSIDYSEDLNQNTELDESSEEEFSETLETVTFEEEHETIVNEFFSEDDNSSFDMDATSATGLLAGSTNMLSGRSAAERSKLARQRGGSAASENAVRLAMEWLAAHQLQDGSWSFDHRFGPGTHRTSPNPGDFRDAPNAATAMALLVFLGAGQTHVEGDFKEVVERGLAFLINNGERRNGGLSFFEGQGGLYNHGLAAICLTEAYAMTEDPRLARPAQLALRYIEYSQDPIGGGWRYEPKEPGDTSAVGWQIMALKSANMSGLVVSDATIRGATKFLNFVSTESGSFYGYTTPSRDRRRGTTSVGLLCRMYLGWTRDNPALTTGVNWLSDIGPAVGKWGPQMTEIPEEEKTSFKADMYFNYYATQVLSQYGGEQWDEWNLKMREFLIASQSTEGNSKGSWFFNNRDELGMIHGGRLYATCLAAMTLEVYYRYLPLYDDEKVADDEFILD